jgi:ATP-independent RNA helicase DbpA
LNKPAELPATFVDLSLPAPFLDNLSQLGFEQPTEIQVKTIPLALEGKDILAKAKTGSGKTMAFATPMLLKLNPSLFQVQAIVLCPTRELADQVAKELRRLARFQGNIKILTLCGGVPFGPQLGSLEHGAHIVVGTPGRTLAHLKKGSLKLDRVNCFVLDEADRMLDMGFVDPIRELAEQIPSRRQTLMFSATYPDDIETLSRELQRDAVEVRTDEQHQDGIIEQRFLLCDKDEKLDALMFIMEEERPSSSLVFCNTIRECKDVAAWLQDQNISALALHGDLEQRDRSLALLRFTNESIRILVATDVAARGLHVDQLPLVVNYGLSRDIDVHTHRIGRTGRAGEAGLAYSLYTDSEAYKIAQLETRFEGSDLKMESYKDRSEPDYYADEPFGKPAMVTLAIDGGKKDKVRAGDILGALTGDAGIAGQDVGKIDITDFHAYVAIRREVANAAHKRLQAGKIKGRSFKIRRL